ncbi:MAG: hypothetical protein ABI863_11640 [Ginsengibacter sp.]
MRIVLLISTFKRLQNRYDSYFMKASHFTRLIILFFYTIACVNKNSGEAAGVNDIDTSVAGNVTPNAVIADTFETGKIITHVYCSADAAQSYALYIPSKGNNRALPVIYFFDPHGDGSFPLGKYKALADAYDFILAGSNNSKNGNDWPTTENIWRIMFDDSQKRLKINGSLIYTCGFSGGAKVAGYVALNNNEVKGVIANGAGLPDGTPAANFRFSFTAIAGAGDMNMTDLVAISSNLDKTLTRHRIIFFDGKHEWAPEKTMNIAFACLQLDAMHEKLIPVDNVFINNFIAGSRKKIADYLKINHLVKAEQECKLSISMLDGLTNELTWFTEKDSSVKTNPVYQKQLQTEQNLLTTEDNLKEGYVKQFQQDDMNYWVKTIGDLQIKSKPQTPEGAMYQRLLAYLSLAFYSISNRLITGNQNNEAQYFVNLYKMADATNSEAWYFSAILNARNNNANATKDDLLRAITCGFANKDRMMQQPEFQSLASQINFPEIESKMK